MREKWQNINFKFEKFARFYINKQVIPSTRLKQAIIYSFLSGGKLIRALLSYTSGSCFYTSLENQNLSAIAIEAMHAYSLIHDDLPSMDNDSFRRGKLSCHIKFNESTAILAGDALQSLAFQALSETSNITIIQLQKALKLLSTHAGSQGMVSGQQLDIDARNKTVYIKYLKQIHSFKTGKIFKAAVLLPFYLSPSYLEKDTLKYLGNFAENIGLAFQIQDDILDYNTKDIEFKEAINVSKISKNVNFSEVIGTKKAISILGSLINNSKRNLLKIETHETKTLVEVIEYIFKKNDFKYR